MSGLSEVVLDEKIENTTREPSKYNVIFMNDDKTPMEWVIRVLMDIFRHSSDSAKDLTMKIHHEGSAVVGSYYYEIAEQKAAETMNSSRANGFPLKVTIEEQS